MCRALKTASSKTLILLLPLTSLIPEESWTDHVFLCFHVLHCKSNVPGKSSDCENSQTWSSSRDLWLQTSNSGLGSQFLHKVLQVVLRQPAELRSTVQCLGNTNLFQVQQAIVSFFSLLLTLENVYSINQIMTHLVGFFVCSNRRKLCHN